MLAHIYDKSLRGVAYIPVDVLSNTIICNNRIRMRVRGAVNRWCDRGYYKLAITLVLYKFEWRLGESTPHRDSLAS